MLFRSPPKPPFFSFPAYQSPYERRSASQKRTLGFYSATILVYFGNRAAYGADPKKVCKSAAFLAHFYLPAPGSRETLRRRNRSAGSQVPGLGSTPPKNLPFPHTTYRNPSGKRSAAGTLLLAAFSYGVIIPKIREFVRVLHE